MSSAEKYHYDFYKLADPTVVVAPIGLALGRLGNFINAELYGRATNLPWGMLFPGEQVASIHLNSMNYFSKAFLLFIILFTLIKRMCERICILELHLFYGLFRFFVEFVREPDAQLGHLIGFMTMGQIMSSFMMIAGIIGYISIFRKKTSARDQRK